MKKHLIPIFILIAFSAILIKVMVFKDVPVIRVGPMMLNFGGTHVGRANLIPFKTILPYLLGEKGLIIGSINIVGNIVLLVPIGFLVPFVYRKMTWKKSLVLAVAAGLSIELMQELLRVGIFDIDDVILNAVGVLIGYWAFTIIPRLLRLIKSNKAVFIVGIVSLSALAFYSVIVFQKILQPVNSSLDATHKQFGNFEEGKTDSLQTSDPCNGTGGTGQIMSTSLVNKQLTIKRRDGVIQVIKLSNQTTIRNSTGLLAPSDLKMGDHVTLVVETKNADGSLNASLVLACSVSSGEPKK